ncbi:DUF6340 family protein [uncultured Sunxiuqinia sp.]|jgi:uncharacterized protein DUF6340|uniref:DUF6340 family protein n=1 Tax=uncultured Sunxiuqinia sp. TaxID=1573825 RepID=UPI0019BF0991|nr:hypothetical protein [Sunxiuqinia sp.]|tara:strand:+ start:70641 stop:71690 length:1050 start_codon:yes stop_codon:yes gene_type:complete
MKINKYYKIAALSFGVLFMASCASSYKTVYVEVAKPSAYLLSNDIVSLTLMNRSMTDEFNNFPADSLQNYFYRRGFEVSAAVLDSSAADTTLKVLAELLFESGRYDVVIPEDRNIPRSENYFKVLPPLEWNYVSEICETYETDALLVLERYMNKVMTDYMKVPYSEMHEASIDSKYDAIVRIYDPAKKEIVQQLIVADTIYWSEADYSQKNLFTNRLVPIKQALLETGIQIALELDARLSPQWQTQTRGYFVLKQANSPLLESAIRNNNWAAAYEHWQDLLSKTNSKSAKSKLEYNLAIASEMIGNLDEAAQWATQSYQTQYRRQTESYLYQLKSRKQTVEAFKKYSED